MVLTTARGGGWYRTLDQSSGNRPHCRDAGRHRPLIEDRAAGRCSSSSPIAGNTGLLPIPDLLIAATAEIGWPGRCIRHKDFELIGAVTGQRWKPEPPIV